MTNPKKEHCAKCKELVEELWITDDNAWLCPDCWAKLLMESENGEVLAL